MSGLKSWPSSKGSMTVGMCSEMAPSERCSDSSLGELLRTQYICTLGALRAEPGEHREHFNESARCPVLETVKSQSLRPFTPCCSWHWVSIGSADSTCLHTRVSLDVTVLTHVMLVSHTVAVSWVWKAMDCDERPGLFPSGCHESVTFLSEVV